MHGLGRPVGVRLEILWLAGALLVLPKRIGHIEDIDSLFVERGEESGVGGILQRHSSRGGIAGTEKLRLNHRFVGNRHEDEMDVAFRQLVLEVHDGRNRIGLHCRAHTGVAAPRSAFLKCRIQKSGTRKVVHTGTVVEPPFPPEIDLFIAEAEPAGCELLHARDEVFRKERAVFEFSLVVADCAQEHSVR